MPASVGKTRVYNHAVDREAVLRLCEGVYGGEDYLPNRLDYMANEHMCCPIVLENTDGAIVAFANMRSLHANVECGSNSRGCSIPIFLEAVRVLPRAYGKGYGRAVVRCAATVARAAFSESAGESKVEMPTIVSVTIPSNLAMLRIFRSVGFDSCGSGKMHIWPSYSRFTAITDVGTPMLNVLNVEKRIPATAWELMDAWTPLVDRDTFTFACSTFKKESSASGFVPGYYALDSVEGVCQAMEENRATAWKLEDNSEVLVVQKNLAISKASDQIILSVLATSIVAAEAAVAFADRRLCLSRFRAVFDANLGDVQLQDSLLLGSVELTPFVAFSFLPKLTEKPEECGDFSNVKPWMGI